MMIAIDTSVLVYAHRRETGQHEAALTTLHEFAEGTKPWAIPWPCCFEFFSIVTKRGIWGARASSQEQAVRQLSAWMESPSCRLINETPGFMVILRRLALRPGVRGAVVNDARIAAICLAHGVEALLTADRDFQLFPELILRPLTTS